jgi:hypothetical protein
LRVMVSITACQSRPRVATRMVMGSVQARSCAAGDESQVPIHAVPG